jgi:phosphate acetyltransferase
MILDQICNKAKLSPKRIVLPEANDSRIVEAARMTLKEGVADVVLVGSDLSIDDINVESPISSNSRSRYVDALFKLRRHKGLSLEQANNLLNDPLVFAAMMVNQGDADGMVAGAINTTADVVRTAIQLVGMSDSSNLVSSFFLMIFDKDCHPLKRGFIFSDGGLVINPDVYQLAHIALSSAKSAKSLLSEEPKVAMLSFSTHGSAKDESVDKVRIATKLARDLSPDLKIEGEMQVDAALVPDIAVRKMEGGQLSGDANVLIFPDLNSGNIAYKVAERLGGAIAIGPLLQGLKYPVNDLSRGCSVNDIFHAIAITSVQAN